ncbi:MAG: hypothetical protein ACI89X_003135 [Planctomycetota bacterium]|jgi:hypothetical protein
MPRLRVNVRLPRPNSLSSKALSSRADFAALVAGLLLAMLCCVTALPAQSSSTQKAKVAAPQRFERILWCADGKAGPELARKSGYTAVQLGRGGDATPLRSLGLRFYLDQPIGKGLLELRDSDWQPVVQLFERTRDASQLVRPQCFAWPDLIGKAAAAAAREARRVGPEGMLFVALADEASSTRHNAPLDSCQCAHCLTDFRAYVRKRFSDVDALNSALGTHYLNFDVAVPVSTDQLRGRELGDRLLPADLRPFSLWLDFVDDQFATAVRTIRERVQAAVPGVPVGLTGLAVPGPFGGHDYGRLITSDTIAEPYDIGGSIELARSLLPRGAHRYATLIPPVKDTGAGKINIGKYVRARLMAMASQGMAGVVVWNDRTIAGEDGKETKFGTAVRSAFEKHGAEFDTLAGAEIESSPVWVVESHASVRAWWMIDSAKDGMTWVRRLASYEEAHSTSQAARLSWIRLLQDLGQQPQFVTAKSLPERLLNERPRCVVLPATLALSDRTVTALNVYVRNGGSLLADHSTAIYDERLQRRERGALDELFGIEKRSLLWHDLLVREGQSTSRDRGLPAAERLLRGETSHQETDSDTFLERSIGGGHAYYLNSPVVAYNEWRLDQSQIVRARELRRRVRTALRRARVSPACEVTGKGLPTCIERVSLKLRDGRRVLAIRINALARPRLMRKINENGPIPIEVTFQRQLKVRELNGKDHGKTAIVKTMLDPFGAVFLEVVR